MVSFSWSNLTQLEQSESTIGSRSFFKASSPPSPSDNLLQSLDLNLITPALGLASGAAALFFSRFRSLDTDDSPLSDVGDWILFASPTPFNRFVLLRCPSISFEGSGDGVSEKLLREEKHYVSVSSERIQLKRKKKKKKKKVMMMKKRERDEDELSYQRVCVAWILE